MQEAKNKNRQSDLPKTAASNRPKEVAGAGRKRLADSPVGREAQAARNKKPDLAKGTPLKSSDTKCYDKSLAKSQRFENRNRTRELDSSEKNSLKAKLGWGDRQIARCTIDDRGVIHYDTDNSRMEGKTNVSGVFYGRKTITINGVKIEGVFPRFKSVFDTQLPADKLKSRAYAVECNKKLQEAVANNPGIRNLFTDRQLKDIEAGRTPTGYVWHHNEEVGKMQLVKEADHKANRHTGGNALWGPDCKN